MDIARLIRLSIRRLAPFLVIVPLLLTACVEADEGPLLPASTPGLEVELIEVFFTDPTWSGADSFRGGLDRKIVDSIDAARQSVDVAIYELNLWSIRDALIDAHQRGVRVRVVAESDSFDYEEFADLKNAGIPVLGDRREGLMHNKFMVIDGFEVWTGSVNFTTTDMYLNNNNLLQIRSAALAENYTREFEEMFVDDRFGDTAGSDTPHPSLMINGVSVENYFSPDDGAAQAVISCLSDAQTTINFLAFSFTSDQISEALVAAVGRGVRVSGVMEEAQVDSNTGTEYENLRLGGVDVHLDGNRRNMHNKVFIIDEHIVIAGSYNFTSSAENRNDENLIIIDDPALAARYQSEFQKILEISSP